MQSKNYWGLINDNILKSDRVKLSKFILNAKKFTSGKYVKEFENKWSKWLDVKHSTMVNSGASANLISIALVKELYGKGEVIVPSIGWSTDVSTIIQLGMKPVFVDVDMKNLSIRYEDLINAYSKNTKAVVLIHLLGFNGINNKILSFIKKKKLFLIEDCCEAHGAKFKNKKAGTFGDVSVFSYYFGHHMTTIEGGMISTNKKEIYELSKMFRSHGMIRENSQKIRKFYKKHYPSLNPLFTFAVSGFNVRSTEINAFLGLLQLKRLDKIITKRKENLKIWLNSLSDQIFYKNFDTSGNSNFALPLILLKQDKTIFNKILQYLKTRKIEYRKGTAGGGNLTSQPFVKNIKKKVINNLQNSNHIHNFGLYIGNHTELKEKQIKSLAKNLNNI